MSPCESQELGSCLGTHTEDGTAFSFLNAYMHAQKRNDPPILLLMLLVKQFWNSIDLENF